MASMRRHGPAALMSFNPDAWLPVLLNRIQPIYARYLIDGRNAQAARLRKRTKSLAFVPFPNTDGSSYVMAGGNPHDPDEPEDDTFTIYNPEAVNFINQYSYAFAQSTAQTTRMKLSNAYQKLQDELAKGIEQGEALKTVTADVMRIFRDPQRAMTIAASEVSRAYHAGQEIAAKQSGVVSGKKWLSSTDACEKCLELDGKVVALGEPFTILPGGGAYAKVMYPPLHPRCVLGETPIRMASLVSAMKSHYYGPIVRLHFSDGSSFSVTSNHMLLTSFGFLRASDLMEGDNVICTSGGKDSTTPATISPNNNNAPTTAHQIFHSFREAGGVSSSSVPVSAEYLHGDSAFCDGNINIVRTNGFLGCANDSSFSEPVNHLPFVFANMLCGISFSGCRQLATELKRLLFATNGIMGRSRELLALLRGVSSIAKKLGFRPTSDIEAKFFESANDARTADAQRLRHLKDTFPGIISQTNVIKVESIILHEGVPVYDFETEESMYIVGNGIVSSNCMCSMTDVLSDEWNPGETAEDWFAHGRN